MFDKHLNVIKDLFCNKNLEFHVLVFELKAALKLHEPQVCAKPEDPDIQQDTSCFQDKEGLKLDFEFQFFNIVIFI